MARGGRPRKSGKRYKNGELVRATTRAGREGRIEPNDRVKARLERFSHNTILGGKAAHDTFDGAGQLHAMGYFHDNGHEPDVIRDAFREYGELYWYWFACLNSGAAEYETSFGGGSKLSSKSSPLPPKARAERRFQQLESFLPESLGSPERIALHALVVGHWGSDTVHPFVERLVNDGMAQRKLPVSGMLSLPEDRETLKAALRAAFLMIEGGMKPDYINPLGELRRAA